MITKRFVSTLWDIILVMYIIAEFLLIWDLANALAQSELAMTYENWVAIGKAVMLAHPEYFVLAAISFLLIMVTNFKNELIDLVFGY